MYYIYRTISDFYSSQLSKELKKNKDSNVVATILNQKASFWFSMMIHAKGAL